MKIEYYFKHDALRQLCIRDQFCTCCTNEEYEPIINTSTVHPLTNQQVLKLAKMIWKYSDQDKFRKMYNISDQDILKSIVWKILNECVVAIPHLEEEEL